MSRFDSVGLFWEDLNEERIRGKIVRAMPPIPETGWVPPAYFPDLSNAGAIAVDTETWDPELEDHGPGWARGKGHLVGVSIGVEGGSWYFPMRHEVCPEQNLDPEQVLAWLRKTLSNPKQPKIGANLMYDIGWLAHEGVQVKGELIDVQYAEALLDERAEVNLEALGQKYLHMGKESSLMYKWCSDFYGGPATGTQRKNIYRCPPCLVGPYAESDADLPLRLATPLYYCLIKEGLYELFRMECDLIYLMVAMRQAGVRVDIPKAEELSAKLDKDVIELQKKLNHQAGRPVDINSAESLGRAFDAHGIKYGLTAKTKKPSITKDFLETVQHPMADTIREIRKLEKLNGTFIKSYILNSHVNGMVYGQFHLLRGDSDGTRSGRLSSSTPNLQNIPSRDEILAHLIRGMFCPDYGHRQWRKYDYSQIEYRFLIHFAVGAGADEVRAHFNAHPETDYHEMTLDLVAPVAGWDIATPAQRKTRRKPIKNINFGLIYGMGVDKLAHDLGLTRQQGKALFAAYHKAVPFAKATMDYCSNTASTTGVITTILGRKSRFDLYEPESWDEMGKPALPFDRAIRAYGRVRRAYTHKALNRRLQGSSADQMKKAMWTCWKDGVFDAIGVPRLTVHDELDFSDMGNCDDGFREMHHIMENCIPLRIPVKVEAEVGPDWGHTVALAA